MSEQLSFVPKLKHRRNKNVLRYPITFFSAIALALVCTSIAPPSKNYTVDVFCPSGENLIHQPDLATALIRVWSNTGSSATDRVTFPWSVGITETHYVNGIVVPLAIGPMDCDTTAK